jgi:hypothetical protein
MAQETKAQKAFVAQKDRERDREDTDPPQARIEKRGFGGMDTKNKATDTGKKGI